jgi:hypothetical protein
MEWGRSSVGGEGEGLGVVEAEVGDLDTSGHDGADLVAMVDNVAASGHKDVIAVDEESLY